MSNQREERTRSRPGIFSRMCRGLKDLFAPRPAAPDGLPQGLGTLQRLEDRRLPSVLFTGPEFRVNTFTSGAQQTFSNGPAPANYQSPHSVAVNPATGDFVVTWQSQNQDGSGWGIYAQRFNAAGVPQGGEFRVNDTTNGDQISPNVAMDDAGDFVITWSSSQNGQWNVYAKQFNASGVARGPEFAVNSQNSDPQELSDVAMDGAGDFAITWSAQNLDGNGWGVFAQRYSSSGLALGSAFLVNTTTVGDQEYSSIGMDPAGNFVVTWSQNSFNSSGWGVYAQQYSAAGVTQGGEFHVNTYTPDDQIYSRVALDSNGNMIFTWSSHNEDGSGWGVYARAYNSLGLSPGGEFRVNTTTADDQEWSALAVNPNDQLVITWSSNKQDGQGWGIFAQNYTISSLGLPQAVGGEYQVNTTTAHDQVDSAVALDDSGRMVFVWSSDHQAGNGWSVYGQRAVISNILVTPTAGLTTTDAGGQATFQVSLARAPLGTVTLPVSSSDTGQGTVSTPALVFDTLDWNQPQTVTVTGVNNGITDGNVGYFIQIGPASSTDANFQGQVGPQVSVVNKEAGAPGINVTGSTFLVSVDNSVLRVNSLTGTVIATYPTGVLNDGSTFGPDGSLYVADYYNNQILHYDATGAFLSSFGSGQLSSPQGLTFGPDGNLYVTNTNSTIQEFSSMGTFLGTFVTAGSGGLSNAKAIVWGSDGNAYVSSYFNSEVLRYNGTTGAFMNVFATGSGGFEDLTFGPDGNLYVASYGDNAIYRYRGADGAFLGAFVSGGNLVNPYGLRFDPAGNLDVTSRPLGQIQTYNGTTGAFLGNLATGLTNPAYLTSTTSLVTTEAGTSATFSVSLDSPPTAAVTVNLTSTDPGQGSLSTTHLTFDASNWNQAQTVTVTGLDDHLVNGDQTYQITLAVSSGDSNYNGLTPGPVTVTNQERDQAGFTLSKTSLLTAEDGTADSFTVALMSIPTGPVNVTLISTDPGQGTLSTTHLTFDASNWNQVQTVTVTGLDDHIVNGDQTYQINFAVASGDGNYNGLAPGPITVVNQERDQAGFTLNKTSLLTAEDGTADSFTVALTSIPTGPVNVTLTSTDLGQGALSTTHLTFDAFDWNQAKTVMVTGLDDHLVNGDQTYQINFAVASGDGNYNGLTPGPITVVNQERDQAGFTLNKTGLLTAEDGTADSFTVALTSIPTGPVNVTLTSTDPGQGSLSTTHLTFDASDWKVAQTVTVTGLDDHIVNGDRTYQINIAVASGDANYNGLTPGPITVVNQERDQAGFTLNKTSLLTAEDGTADSFTVALTSIPTGPVNVTLTSTDPGQGSLSTSTLTFDASNWNQAQKVTVTGLDDHVVNGDQTYQISFAVTSGDGNYNGLPPGPITVVNQERDQAGFTLNKTSLLTTEDGTAGSFTIALTSIPIHPVTLTLTTSDPGQGAFSASVLSFDAANWSQAQTVTVTGLDDHIVNGDQTYQITGIAASADGHFNGLNMAPVAVVNQERDTAGITVVAPAGPLVIQGNGTVSFELVLTSKPLGDVSIQLNSSDPSAGYPAQTAVTFTPASWNVPQKVTVNGSAVLATAGNVTFSVATGPAGSTDPSYSGRKGPDVVVLEAASPAPTPAGGNPSGPTGPAAAPVEEPTPPAPGPIPTFIRGAPTGGADPGSSGNLNPVLAPTTGTTSVVSLSSGSSTQAAASSLSRSTVAARAGGLDAEAAGPGLSPAAQAAAGNGRSWNMVVSLAPSPGQEPTTPDNFAQETSALFPDGLPKEKLGPGGISQAGSPTTGPRTPDLWNMVERPEDQAGARDGSPEATALVATGLIASAGYVLLNTRAGFWLLSLATSKPLWKEFDPLEILYVWENETGDSEATTDADREETLVSLVS